MVAGYFDSGFGGRLSVCQSPSRDLLTVQVPVVDIVFFFSKCCIFCTPEATILFASCNPSSAVPFFPSAHQILDESRGPGAGGRGLGLLLWVPMRKRFVGNFVAPGGSGTLTWMWMPETKVRVWTWLGLLDFLSLILCLCVLEVLFRTKTMPDSRLTSCGSEARPHALSPGTAQIIISLFFPDDAGAIPS